jgi:V/A-type H+-transporting ATPase subunit C
MLSGMSSNAVLARARTRFGRRLTEQNFTDLLVAKSTQEVAYYLKNRTYYNDILSDYNESELSRSQLETLLKQSLFEDCASLGRYGSSVGEHMSDYLIRRSEIEQIMHSLVVLNSGKTEGYTVYMPDYLLAKTRIDVEALGHMKTFDHLIEALGKTPYAKIVEKFRPEDGELLDYTGIENALYTYLYNDVYQMINKYYKGDAANQLREIFNSYLDLDNYVRIVRMKTFYDAPPEVIRGVLLPFSTIKKDNMEKLVKARDVQEVHELMAKTRPGKRYLKGKEFGEDIPLEVQYDICRRNIHFSTHASVVMLSYIFVKQAEISDITNILEGIRYGLPASKIAELLTIVNFQ